MGILHRPNGSGRQHFPAVGKPSFSLTPQLLYVGSLQKNPLWQETPHSHRFCEIIFVTEGCGSLNVNGLQKPISRGDIIVYNPGCLHCEKSDSTFPMEILFIAIDKFTIGDMPPCTLIEDNSYAVFHSGSLYSLYRFQFNLMIDEIRMKHPFFHEICTASICTVIYALLRQYHSESRYGLIVPCSSVRNALNYIEKNFSSDITLEAIADVCYVTKFHLAHKFKKATGKTIGEYIRFLRIEKAKKLLSETELSVSSVAYECGYNETNYFHRIFRRETGLPPGEYRKKYR